MIGPIRIVSIDPRYRFSHGTPPHLSSDNDVRLMARAFGVHTSALRLFSAHSLLIVPVDNGQRREDVR